MSDAATVGRDIGIHQAVRHADSVDPSWSELALRYFTLYAGYNRTFLTEEVRSTAEDAGFPVPPDERAWGSVARTAARRGIVAHAGYVASRQAQGHHGPRSLWQSRCYGNA